MLYRRKRFTFAISSLDEFLHNTANSVYVLVLLSRQGRPSRRSVQQSKAGIDVYGAATLEGLVV